MKKKGGGAKKSATTVVRISTKISEEPDLDDPVDTENSEDNTSPSNGEVATTKEVDC